MSPSVAPMMPTMIPILSPPDPVSGFLTQVYPSKLPSGFKKNRMFSNSQFGLLFGLRVFS